MERPEGMPPVKGKNQPHKSGPRVTSQAMAVQGLAGRDVEFTTGKGRGLLSDAIEQSSMTRREKQDSANKGINDVPTQYDQSGNVSLYSCMQTTVPHPYQNSGQCHLNMPGGGFQQHSSSKYLSSNLQNALHPKKNFSTYSSLGIQASQTESPVGAEERQFPQGIQGDDCVRYKLWMENCIKYQLSDCVEQLQGVQDGRKSLSEIFVEQDRMIAKIASNYSSSTSSSTAGKPEVSSVSQSSTQNGETGGQRPDGTDPGPSPEGQLSRRQRLQRAVKQYGATVVVFHVGISLISLGGFYLAVSRWVGAASVCMGHAITYS